MTRRHYQSGHSSPIAKYAYYVHWSSKGAETTLSGMTLSNYATSRLQATANNAYPPKISTAVKKQYAAAIDAAHGRAGNFQSSNNVKPNEVYNAVEEILYEKFADTMTDSVTIDRLTGRIINGERPGVQGKKPSGMFNIRYFQDGNIPEILSQITSLQQTLNEVGRSSRLSAAELESLQTKLETFRISLINRDAMVKNNLWSYGTAGIDYLHNRLVKQAQYYRVDNATTKLLTEINGLIESAGIKQYVMAAQQGFSEEAIALAASYMLSGYAMKSVKDALQLAQQATSTSVGKSGGLIGGLSTTHEWKITGLPDDALINTFLNGQETQTINGVRTIITKTGAQQKIDIVAQLPTYIGSKTLMPVKASVKNVNLSLTDLGIHLVSGTNVWYMIQDEDPKFLRKYLNVMSLHDNQDTQKSSALAQERDDAIFALKIITAVKALTGATFGRESAELFIVNDNSRGGRAYVLEMSDIIQALYNSLHANPSVVETYFKFEHFNQEYFKNKLEKIEVHGNMDAAIHERMGSIIQEARLRKLYIAMRNTVAKPLFQQIASTY